MPGRRPRNSARWPRLQPFGTLREALDASGTTEISFLPGLAGPITLARPAAGGGTLVIEKTLTITGPWTGLVIQRRSTDPAFRIFRIGSGVNVTFTNLTVRGGARAAASTTTARSR